MGIVLSFLSNLLEEIFFFICIRLLTVVFLRQEGSKKNGILKQC